MLIFINFLHSVIFYLSTSVHVYNVVKLILYLCYTEAATEIPTTVPTTPDTTPGEFIKDTVAAKSLVHKLWI